MTRQPLAERLVPSLHFAGSVLTHRVGASTRHPHRVAVWIRKFAPVNMCVFSGLEIEFTDVNTAVANDTERVCVREHLVWDGFTKTYSRQAASNQSKSKTLW